MWCLQDSEKLKNPLGYYENKGSKFLTYLLALETLQKEEDFIALKQKKEAFIDSLKEEHKKARHFVEAFRYYNSYHHIIEGSNDDGEPKGSSGVPLLEVLRGENLINVACICVRYFGGTKLGVGGLVRAYTQSILSAIMQSKQENLLQEYKESYAFILHENITHYNHIVYLAKKYDVIISKKTFLHTKVELEIKGDKENIEKFRESISTFSKM